MNEKKKNDAKERKNMMNFQGKGLVFTLRQYAQSISRIKIPLRGLFLGKFFPVQKPRHFGSLIQSSTKFKH